MIRILFAAIALLLTTASFAAPDTEKQAQFFAGVLLLEAHSELTADQRAGKYRDLQTLTGITPKHAAALLKDFKDAPDAWKTVAERMTTYLAETPTPKENTHVRQ
jgi:hypothetical protein